MDARLWRSALYVPATNVRAMEKARTLPADAIIFDLEDSLLPDAKASAREPLSAALTGDYGRRPRLVRVNGLQTDWGADDLEAVARMPVDGVVLTKAEAADQVEEAARMLDRAGSSAAVWAMIETPRGVLNCDAIARAPRMGGLILGTNDLGSEIRCTGRSDRSAMMAGIQMCLLAARAAGLVCLDGVFNAFRDLDGLRRECREGRELGMDGKTVIHPSQIDVANEVFSPSADEISLARAQIAAYREAKAQGRGVAVLDGTMVEVMHVANAELTLARAEAIREMEAA